MLFACQWSRIMLWFPIISISLFFLGAVFYMSWLRSGTNLITCESELHGCESRMPCPILSDIGTRTCQKQFFQGTWQARAFLFASSEWYWCALPRRNSFRRFINLMNSLSTDAYGSPRLRLTSCMVKSSSGASVLVNLCQGPPDKALHGHHARMLPPKNLAVFALVWFEVVVQPPL